MGFCGNRRWFVPYSESSSWWCHHDQHDPGDHLPPFLRRGSRYVENLVPEGRGVWGLRYHVKHRENHQAIEENSH